MEIVKTEKVTEKAAEILAESVQESRGEVLLLVSGGSAFGLLDCIDESILSDQVTIGVLDERYSEDEAINNFSQLRETDFFKKCQDAGCGFIDTSVKNGESHKEFTNRISGLISENKDKTVIVTMGIGLDSHTAGIMPFPEDENRFKELFENTDLVIGYDAEDKNEFRLRTTVTNTFLREYVSNAILFVSGENKKSALEKTLETSVDLHKVPARIIHSMKNVTIVTNIE